MASLASMPPLVIDPAILAEFGRIWNENGGRLSRTPPYSSGKLGGVFDAAVGKSLATLLGNVPIVVPSSNALVQPNLIV